MAAAAAQPQGSGHASCWGCDWEPALSLPAQPPAPMRETGPSLSCSSGGDSRGIWGLLPGEAPTSLPGGLEGRLSVLAARLPLRTMEEKMPSSAGEAGRSVVATGLRGVK